MTSQHFQSTPEAVNLDRPSEYGTSPGVLDTPGPQPGLTDNQKELDLNIGPEQPKEKIRGAKRKAFMIALGVLIIIAVVTVVPCVII